MHGDVAPTSLPTPLPFQDLIKQKLKNRRKHIGGASKGPLIVKHSLLGPLLHKAVHGEPTRSIDTKNGKTPPAPVWKCDIADIPLKAPLTRSPTGVCNSSPLDGQYARLKPRNKPPESHRRYLSKSNPASPPTLVRSHTTKLSPLPDKGEKNAPVITETCRPPSPSRQRSPSPCQPRSRPQSPRNIYPPDVLQRKITGAQQARLYLFQRPGPNSFCIGDDVKRKFRVTVGPQVCTCGRGDHCVHLLFVMLRVFQLPGTDTRVWAKQLKNYEVESLFCELERRREQLIANGEDSKAIKPSSPSHPKADDLRDEASCSICLREMLPEESFFPCTSGCHNRFHSECAAAWVRECQQQGDTVLCPLCRRQWVNLIPPCGKYRTLSDAATRAEIKSPQHSSIRWPVAVSVPSSPVVKRKEIRKARSVTSTPTDPPPLPMCPLRKPSLPQASSCVIPHPYQGPANAWTQVFGLGFVGCIFSRDWAIRETALKALHWEIATTLTTASNASPLLGGLWSTRVRDVHRFLVSCCQILAVMTGDPVHKVYASALSCMRSLLIHLPRASDHLPMSEFKAALLPIIQTVLRRCSDGTRRSSQLSISLMLELCQPLLTADSVALMDLILECIFPDSVSSSDSHMFNESHRWQFTLGRLHFLEHLLGTQFSESSSATCQRLTSVLEFALKSLRHSRPAVARQARRLLLKATSLCTDSPLLFQQVCDTVSCIDLAVHKQLLRQHPSPSPFSTQPGLQSTSKFIVPRPETKPIATRPKLLPIQPTWKVNSALNSPASSVTGSSSGCSCRNQRASPIALLGVGGTHFSFENNRISLQQPLGRPACLGTTVCEDPHSAWNVEACQKLERTCNSVAAAIEGSTRTTFTPLDLEEQNLDSGHFSDLMHEQDETEELVHFLSNDLDRYTEGAEWTRGHVLGAGAFSTCYQACDRRSGSLMAVKQVSFCRSSAEEQAHVEAAIRQEAALMTQLQHPNVVRLLGVTRNRCHFNMFVEWMAGGSVATLLDKYGAFEEGVLLGYVQQLLLGLDYLHSKHILHRDIKGANLLVDASGQQLRIADFGAAARLRTVNGEVQGPLIGTIAFMAPEVLRGEEYGCSCDVWSVGCVVIEMATTQPPWDALDISNHLALIYKIACCSEPPDIPDHLSLQTRDFALGCLRVNADLRPQAEHLLSHPCFADQRQ